MGAEAELSGVMGMVCLDGGGFKYTFIKLVVLGDRLSQFVWGWWSGGPRY